MTMQFTGKRLQSGATRGQEWSEKNDPRMWPGQVWDEQASADTAAKSATTHAHYNFTTLPSIEDRGRIDRAPSLLTVTLTFDRRPAMVHGQAKNQCQRSVGLKNEVETNGPTDGCL